jgi:hypothetical protein
MMIRMIATTSNIWIKNPMLGRPMNPSSHNTNKIIAIVCRSLIEKPPSLPFFFR